MKIIFVLIVLILSVNSIFPQNDTAIVYLGSIDSTIVTDVKYATKDNFTGTVLYPTSKVYCRKIVADSLKKINNYLENTFNFRLKIFDAYRPLSVQRKMWEIYPDPNFVANPSKGSRHNRGAAVDLTIIDSTGTELDMGTHYDDFTEKAGHGYNNFSANVISNRKLLLDVMIKYGFNPLQSEWWHYDFKDWEKFSIIDIMIK